MDFDGLIIFIHLVSATILVMTLVLMQLVIGPAISKIPDANHRRLAQDVIKGRWHPVVDAVIIILSVTGLFMLVTRWRLIGADQLLHVKVTLGIITLACANLLHFYYRGLKRRLASGNETERLASINRLTIRLEKVTLVTGIITFLLAITFNHL